MKAYEIKPNGFCNGVIRAIKMINKILEDPNTPLPIYMFGYLVHNKKIINGFIENHNIILIKEDFANTLTNIKKGTVIFTAHGISPKIKQIAINNNLNIIDTTCPNVLKIQNKIKEKINDNYKVIVIGNNNHPEVMGYLGIDSNIEMFDESLAFNNAVHITKMADTIISKKNGVPSVSNELASKYTMQLFKYFANKGFKIKMFDTCVKDIDIREFEDRNVSLKVLFKDAKAERFFYFYTPEMVCRKDCHKKRYCLSAVGNYTVLEYNGHFYKGIE